jgi:hypothetical protein
MPASDAAVVATDVAPVTTQRVGKNAAQKAEAVKVNAAGEVVAADDAKAVPNDEAKRIEAKKAAQKAAKQQK